MRDIGDRQIKKKLIIQVAVLLAVCIIVIAGGRLLSGNRFKMTVGIFEAGNITSPLVLIFSLMMIVSNIELLRHESFRVQNVLGMGIGIALILCEVFGVRLMFWNVSGSEMLLRAFYVFTSVYFTTFCYFECILMGSVICGLRAARHVPALRQDYILILGCRVSQCHICHHELPRLQERCLGEACGTSRGGSRKQNKVVVLAECLYQGVCGTACQSISAGDCVAGFAGIILRKCGDSDRIEGVLLTGEEILRGRFFRDKTGTALPTAFRIKSSRKNRPRGIRRACCAATAEPFQ